MIQIPFEHIKGPFTEWDEIIILWRDVFEGPKYPIREILDWLETAEGGSYHLHGFNSTEGFCFQFERPEDATHFKLKWL